MKTLRTLLGSLGLLVGGLAWPSAQSSQVTGHEHIRGVTISCQTWGWEWGSDGFGDELDDLAALGANWVAIHPYARIGADGAVGSLRQRVDPMDPPSWLVRPVAAARERGMALLIKPHLAYWGSPFGWRGEIHFEEAEARARFWREYSEWILALARCTRGAAAFCVGTELDRTLADESEWRELIRRVREVTDARLTYASNWDRFTEVPFWDALDAIGIQAYFPLSESESPQPDELRAGWQRVLAPLRELHARTGKPIVFTELGYHATPQAARMPWSDGRRGHGQRVEVVDSARELQRLCLQVGLEVLEREKDWLRGVFLWKWFVGEPGHDDESFVLDTPALRAVIQAAWKD
jgi:hypothetical protein